MRYVLVTGAARGLGAEICKSLVQSNYIPIIHYRSSFEPAKSLQTSFREQGCQAELIQGEFDSSGDLELFIDEIKKRFSCLHGLVNNVGAYQAGSLLEGSITDWNVLMQVNATAPLNLIKGLQSLLENSAGSVVNIGVAGLLGARGYRESPAYHLTKELLLGITRTLARELAGMKIRVNMVSPGYLENSVSFPSVETAIPLSRIGTLEECARQVIYLLDSKQSYITGQNIEVSGGFGL